MSKIDFSRLKYDDFKKLATNADISLNEKVGFPDSYREGFIDFILQDIFLKLDIENNNSSLFFDIGCGCSNLTLRLAAELKSKNIQYVINDSKEMTDLIKDNLVTSKINGRFPFETHEFISSNKAKFKSVLAYSVIQYLAPNERQIFLIESLSLLAPQGRLLIGDIPNSEMRNRYFQSEYAKEFHTMNYPDLPFPTIEDPKSTPNSLLDADILELIKTGRQLGYNAFVMPQNLQLKQANRREDLLFVKP